MHPAPITSPVVPTGSVRALRAVGSARAMVMAGAAATSGLATADLEALLCEAQETLRRTYMIDMGSGLLRRELFLDRLGQAAAGVARGGASFGVLLIGVATHAGVPTSQQGAHLTHLALTARRLAELGRHSDSFTQLDTGSYAGLLLGTHSLAGSVAMAQKIVECLARPVLAEGRQSLPTVAAGVALCPQHGHQPRELLLHAHAAMRHASTSGQSVAVYAGRMG